MATDRNGLEVLSREEALRLLATQKLGRIGVSIGGLPVILPVNFLLFGDEILIRTAPGSKLEAATRRAVVAFEADSYDAFAHTGWSVTVTGMAREVADEDERATLSRAPIPHWAPGDEHIVAISTEIVSGRRISSVVQRPDR